MIVVYVDTVQNTMLFCALGRDIIQLGSIYAFGPWNACFFTLLNTENFTFQAWQLAGR